MQIRNTAYRWLLIASSVLLLLPMMPSRLTVASTDLAFQTLRSLDILSPTQSDPDYAGPHHSPQKIVIRVTKPADGLQRSDFTVEVGGEPAYVVVVWEGSDEYALEVIPPDTLGANGLYDLMVSAAGESDTEVQAVKYAPAQNVDVVVVLDRSGSMSGSTNIPGVNKLEAAKKAAILFVNLMVDGDKLGLVSFSTIAKLEYALTTVTAAVRQAIVAAITPLYPSGTTTIGGGLEVAQDQLEQYGAADEPWAIVLLSDGRHNTPPDWWDVLPRIEQSKTAVHTIGLGTDADEATMLEIASRTGGTYSYAPDASQLQRIYNTIAGTVRNQQTLISLSGNISPGGNVTKTVIVDSTVTEAVFSVGWNKASTHIQMTLIRPDGSLLDPTVAASDPTVRYVSGATFAYYHVERPLVGEWIVQLSSSSTTRAVGVAGTDQADIDTYSLVVSGQTNLTLRLYADERTYPIAGIIRLSATLADTEPITTARVVGVGTGPTGHTYTFNLYDDGAHQDGAAADGVYAGAYPKTYVEGTHTFVVRAEGKATSGEAFVRQAEMAFNVTGTPSSDTTVNVTLQEAWNLISFDVMPHDTDVATVMNAIANNYTAVLGFDGEGYSYYPQLPDTINTLQEMDPYHGYWIRSTAVVTLPVVGPEVPDNTPISLRPGWNLVSYLPNASMTITDALRSIEGLYTAVLGYDQGAMSSYPDLPGYMNTLHTMERFRGYWIHMTAPATLIYPSGNNAGVIATASLPPNAPQSAAGINPTNQWVNFYGFEVLVDGKPAPIGTTISVYDPDGVKIGEMQIRRAGTYGVLSAYADDPLTPEDEGALPGDRLTFYINGQPALAVGPDQPIWTAPGERHQVNLWIGAAPFRVYIPLILRTP